MKWLVHPWLRVRCAIALGALFVAAALPKLADPPAFAKALWAYDLFPFWSVHTVALALPWLEAIAGLALCLGVKVRVAATWITVLLAAFILALSINLARRHPVDCGCFTSALTARTPDQKLGDMRWAILRDLGMLLLAVPLLVRRREEMPPCA